MTDKNAQQALEALNRIKLKLERAGAKIPCENEGTIESAMQNGLSIALLLVTDEIAGLSSTSSAVMDEKGEREAFEARFRHLEQYPEFTPEVRQWMWSAWEARATLPAVQPEAETSAEKVVSIRRIAEYAENLESAGENAVAVRGLLLALNAEADAAQADAPVAEPVAWANFRHDPPSYVPFRTREEAQRSVDRSAIAATQEGPYSVVGLVPVGTRPPAPEDGKDAADAKLWRAVVAWPWTITGGDYETAWTIRIPYAGPYGSDSEPHEFIRAALSQGGGA